MDFSLLLIPIISVLGIGGMYIYNNTAPEVQQGGFSFSLLNMLGHNTAPMPFSQTQFGGNIQDYSSDSSSDEEL